MTLIKNNRSVYLFFFIKTVILCVPFIFQAPLKAQTSNSLTSESALNQVMAKRAYQIRKFETNDVKKIMKLVDDSMVKMGFIGSWVDFETSIGSGFGEQFKVVYYVRRHKKDVVMRIAIFGTNPGKIVTKQNYLDFWNTLANNQNIKLIEIDPRELM